MDTEGKLVIGLIIAAFCASVSLGHCKVQTSKEKTKRVTACFESPKPNELCRDIN